MIKNKVFTPSLALKGFAMGIADVIPGVSGGTIAFVTGIYDELLDAISSVNKDFFKKILAGKFVEALEQLHWRFLLSLLTGVFSAILLTSRMIHYLMDYFPVYTWSFFFGLVGASSIYIGREIENRLAPSSLFALFLGIVLGYLIVSLVPVSTPDNLPFIFLSGAVAICAMILPGISGSFILLILGKYIYVMSAVKNPFAEGMLPIIIVFASGCLIGLISFSKLLNFLLHRFRSLTMAVLTGFMIGSLKKVWPWKEVLEKQMSNGKEYVLREAVVLPSTFNSEVIIAICLCFIGAGLVFGLEKLAGHKSDAK